ncbi:hypothetical protein FGO68_gene17799 [Halteria grandinella]|uniref:Uncharacterized protein n=1 Tax=Halteria grandinella TaxID=5974 RepID=A0A8J8NMB9_HALGN|nr:hypothetical protein FGO68_gene17799 [Halteria grandinella]
MTYLCILIALGLSSALATIANSCLWCLSQGSTWNPDTKICGSGNKIFIATECYRQMQYPNIVQQRTIYKNSNLDPNLDIPVQWPAAYTPDREMLYTAKNAYGSDLSIELRCQPGSKIVAYAGVGPDEYNVEQVPFECGDTITLKDGQIGGIDLIHEEGAETAIIRISTKGIFSLSTGAIIGIAVGAVALLVIIGVGICCYINKRRENLYMKLAAQQKLLSIDH